MIKPLRLGFIGAGNNTRRRHIPAFKKLSRIELAAVANRSKESGERVAGEFGIARVYGDWRELVQAPDLDAVCIGTWPNTHREITEAALANGKHVLCEARMAMNAAEGRQMLAAAQRAPSLVAQLVPSPFTLEFDATLHSLLAEGFVGEVLAVELHTTREPCFVESDEPMQYKQDISLSGNNILNMGIWYEAMMRWLGTARRVMAMAKIVVPQRRNASGAMQDVRIPEHVDVLATLVNGAIAHMRFSSVTALAPANEVWIYGSDGTLRFEADAGRLSGGRRGDRELHELPVPAEKRIGRRVEEEFVNAVRGMERVKRTTFEDGVRYMEFTDAVVRSMATGGMADVGEL